MSAVGKTVRVLIVDDSAVIRGALGRMLDAAPDISVVTTAPNGRLALDALKHVSVDVVLLDVEMPELDGLATLPRILAEHPGVRVIMASSLTQRGASITLQALALGAADYISKPSSKAGAASLGVMSNEIIAKVRAIGGAGYVPPKLPVAHPTPPSRVSTTILGGASADVSPRVLAIASSTGGPNALAEVLSELPRDFPLPTLVTQHMPPLFTGLLAQRLARDTGRECVEGRDGEIIRGGCTYVAPGDFHMIVATHEGRAFIRLTQTPSENHCRPAADVMLRSIASTYGAAALAVVLTGMGEDGRRGCEVLRAAGGRVVTQDEATSVVWGMPGAVTNAGLANWCLPLSDIAHRISTLCCVPSL